MRAALIVAFALLAASSAHAAGKRPASASAGQPLAPAPQSQPLSSTECNRLGGHVNNGVTGCKITNQSCSVVKPNGEVLVSCIDEF